MKVGALLPAYNVRPYIETCLTTINAQTHKTYSYIVDDCSSDGLRAFLADRPTWYTKYDRHYTRLGWPRALNRAAELAIADRCDYLFIMNSDDFLRLDCIARAVDTLRKHDWAVVYAQQIGGENVVQISKENAALEDFKEYPPLVNYALVPSWLWQRVGGYSTDISLPKSYGYKEDWDFWIKVFKAGFSNYGVVKEPVYYYVMHSGQLHEPGLGRTEEARQLILAKHSML